MNFIKRVKIGRIILALTLITVLAVPFAPSAQGGGQVITPPSSYSDPGWRDKAARYQSNLVSLQSGLAAQLRADQFRLLTSGEAAAGGLGFWPNPVNPGSQSRYIAVFARMQIPPPSTGRAFPDSQIGRIMTIIDAYGKTTISLLAQQLKAMPDPQIAGGAIIFIYGKQPLADPSFEQGAEALALFIPRENVIAFAELRMTLQTLFSASEMLPVLEGQEQIHNLRLYVIQP